MQARNYTVLSCLLCLLTLGPAGAAFAERAPGRADGKQPRHPAAGTTYRVVNLAAGQVISASINAGGQVAYSLTPDPFSAPVNAFFYNGSSSQNIGSLDGPGEFARTTGITSSGKVAGVSRNAVGALRAFIWNRWTGMADIGTLPGADEALEPVVNNHGVITAIAHNTATSFNRGFRWSAAGGITDLGVLAPGPAASSYPRAINDAGVIAGDSWAFGNDYHAFRWTFGTGMVDIHTNASNDSTPAGVSAAGHVAGNYHVDGETWRGYLWTPGGGMVDLAPPAVDTWVTGMSASGRITGQIGDPFAGTRAMTWTQGGALVDLGTLGGAISSAAAANNKGQVIGAAQTGAGPVHAFVWTAAEGMVDLNTRLRSAPPGLVLEGALAISDNGAIVAVANTGLVLLKPVGKTPCGCPHSVGPIVASDMVAVGAPFAASLGVAGAAPSAHYGVTWNWGDGNAVRTATTPQSGGERRASASHSYAMPGIYTVTAKVSGRDGASVEVSRTVLAYAPGTGMAAGAGSFVSPLSAGKAAQRYAGKARFSLLAATTGLPSAPAAFRFEVGGLHFVSKDFQPIALQGARARFDGSGAVNGKDGYRFTLAVTASNASTGEPGRLKLKIWHDDRRTGKEVVDYDNRDERAAGSGAAAVSVQREAGESSGSALAEGGIALY